MTSSSKIIGTPITEWMFQKRALDLIMRGSVRAFETITGCLVRSSSSVTPSAGMPATERLRYLSMSRSPPCPMQPRNSPACSSRRWMLQRSTPTSAATSRTTTRRTSSRSRVRSKVAPTRAKAANTLPSALSTGACLPLPFVLAMSALLLSLTPSCQQRTRRARIDLGGLRHLGDLDVLVHRMRLLEVTRAERDRRGLAEPAVVRAHQLGGVHPAAVELADHRFLAGDLFDGFLERLHSLVRGVHLAGAQPEAAGAHRQQLVLEAHLAVLLLEHSQERVDRLADAVERRARRREDRQHRVAALGDRPAAARQRARGVRGHARLEPLRVAGGQLEPALLHREHEARHLGDRVDAPLGLGRVRGAPDR